MCGGVHASCIHFHSLVHVSYMYINDASYIYLFLVIIIIIVVVTIIIIISNSSSIQ